MEALEWLLTTGLFCSQNNLTKEVSTPLRSQSAPPASPLASGYCAIAIAGSGSYWTLFVLTVLPLYQVARILTDQEMLL